MMKKIVLRTLSLLIVVAMSGCKVYKASMSQPTNNPLPTKLQKMSFDWQTVNVQGGNVDFIKNLVQSEISTNYMNIEKGKPYGRFEIILNEYKLKQNLGLAYLSGATLFALNILGMPISSTKVDIDMTIRVLDANDDVVKSFKYEKHKKMFMGLYYGGDAAVCVVKVMREILSDFRADLLPEVANIDRQLAAVQQSSTQQQVIIQQVGGSAAPQINAISITTPFAEQGASSVLAVYKNEFGKYEMPEKDDSFPYVAIRVKLQGDPNLIRLAKQTLTLNLGQMFQTEQTVTSYDNMILFLIPAGAKNVYLTCGDGCERQMIYSGGLHANKIYDGVIMVK